MKRNHGRRRWPGFVLDEEKLLQCKGVSAYWKLQWLEDANNFLLKVKDKKIKRLWEKFRSGEI